MEIEKKMKVFLWGGVIGYYIVLMLFFFSTPSQFLGGASISSNELSDINSSEFNSQNEFNTDTGGLWGFFNNIASIIGAIGRFILFAVLGVGLATDTPSIIQYMFSGWSILITMVAIALLIDAVH